MRPSKAKHTKSLYEQPLWWPALHVALIRLCVVVWPWLLYQPYQLTICSAAGPIHSLHHTTLAACCCCHHHRLQETRCVLFCSLSSQPLQDVSVRIHDDRNTRHTTNYPFECASSSSNQQLQLADHHTSRIAPALLFRTPAHVDEGTASAYFIHCLRLDQPPFHFPFPSASLRCWLPSTRHLMLPLPHGS